MPLANFASQKAFVTKEKSRAKKLTSSDVIVIIKGHEDLTYHVKSASLPTIKPDEMIEFSTPHGAKTGEAGYVHSFNPSLTITFMENQDTFVKDSIEKIALEDENNSLVIEYYTGRNVDKMKLWGTIEYGSLISTDSPESDSEGTTTVMDISATISGHFVPPKEETIVDLATKLNLSVE